MAYGRRRSTRKGGIRKTRAAGRRAYTRRRRSVSGLGKIDQQNVIGLVLGGIGSQFIEGFLPAASTLDPKILSAAKIGVGLFLPGMVKGKGSGIAKGISDALITTGAIGLAQDFGVLNGIGKYLHVAGLGNNPDVPTISGQLNDLRSDTMEFSDGDVPTISGMESEFESDYV